MGSLQSEAEGSPTPEVTEVSSFERLLPVVLRYPLDGYILSFKMNWCQVDKYFELHWLTYQKGSNA